MSSHKLSHIAIIMDGNGRWAKKKGLSVKEGHKAGSLVVKKIVQACINLKIKYLSLYAFSTENWRRSKTEITDLMNLLANFIQSERDNFHKNGIRLLISGDLSRFPGRLQKDINDTINLTENNNKLTVNVALNYGSRFEILKAVREIAEAYKKNKISLNQINEKKMENYLYNNGILPVPDILIRTSGELRISNYMLWQIAYTELFFIKVLWPDFNENTLKKIIDEYAQRERRFGGR